MRVVWCVALAVLLWNPWAWAENPAEKEGSEWPWIGTRDAVNGEFHDVAKALRSLDQSYYYRGMRGTGSWTAGSAFMDWEAQGIPPEQRWQVQPPPELDLSGYSSNRCGQCGVHVRCGETHSCQECVLVPAALDGELPQELIQIYATHNDRPWRTEILGDLHRVENGLSLSTCRHTFTLDVKLDLTGSTAAYTPIVQNHRNWWQADVALGQVGQELRFRLRTHVPDQFGSLIHEINLGCLESGTHHIQLCYHHQELHLTIDGEHQPIHGITGKFCNWNGEELWLGDPRRINGWEGVLKSLSLGCQACDCVTH
jgi:hypothetical protein